MAHFVCEHQHIITSDRIVKTGDGITAALFVYPVSVSASAINLAPIRKPHEKASSS